MNMIISSIKEDGVVGRYEWRVAMQIRYSTFSQVIAFKDFSFTFNVTKDIKIIILITTHLKTKSPNLTCLLKIIFISTSKSIKYECTWKSKTFLRIKKHWFWFFFFKN